MSLVPASLRALGRYRSGRVRGHGCSPPRHRVLRQPSSFDRRRRLPRDHRGAPTSAITLGGPGPLRAPEALAREPQANGASWAELSRPHPRATSPRARRGPGSLGLSAVFSPALPSRDSLRRRPNELGWRKPQSRGGEQPWPRTRPDRYRPRALSEAGPRSTGCSLPPLLGRKGRGWRGSAEAKPVLGRADRGASAPAHRSPAPTLAIAPSRPHADGDRESTPRRPDRAIRAGDRADELARWRRAPQEAQGPPEWAGDGARDEQEGELTDGQRAADDEGSSG